MAETALVPPVARRSRGRTWLIRSLVLLIVALAAGGGALYYYADTLIERHLRPATIALLEERFESAVELSSLKVSMVPSLSVRGEGLTLRKKGRTDIPPLIVIRAFTISASPRELWERRIERVHLEGLEIMVPPKRGADMPGARRGADGNSAEAAPDGAPDAFIKEIITENSLLTIMSKQAGKRPRVFQLRKIRFENFQFSKPSAFEADLSNPTPEGDIAVVGSFGPWQADEPSQTPIAGSFLFNADLATIKGIGGALHAEGNFSGPLDYIRTSGKTRTEGFYLSSGGEKFPLTVDYDAVVDGTNGDTHLERVEGRLAQSTHHGPRRHRPGRGREGTPHHARHVHQRRPPRGLRQAHDARQDVAADRRRQRKGEARHPAGRAGSDRAHGPRWHLRRGVGEVHQRVDSESYRRIEPARAGEADRRVDRRRRVEPARRVPAPRRAHEHQVAQLPRERRRGAARRGLRHQARGAGLQGHVAPAGESVADANGVEVARPEGVRSDAGR